MNSNNKKTISWVAIFFLSTLIGTYAIISSKYPYSSDRGNYAIRFVGNWEAPFTGGLNLLADFLHLFSNNPSVLFFSVSFLSMFVSLCAYREFEGAYPQSLLLITLSEYSIYSLFLLKQAPSIAFSALSIASLFKKKPIPCIVFLVIAIFFHEAALILIPLYIVMLGAKKRWVRILEYSLLIVCVLSFRSTSRIVLNISQRIPNITEELNTYVEGGEGLRQSINILTIFKGFPYFFITLYALFKRPRLKKAIDNYDRYLVLSVFASMMIVLSLYMYWMWRFSAYCYFPMFIFAALMMRECKSKNERFWFYLLVGGSLIFFTFRYLFQMFFLYGGF